MTGTVELHVEKDRVYWIQTDNNAGASQEAEVDANDNYVVVITNTAGVELPMTGGIGTHINTLSGLVLMAGALMYGFRMRRRERRNE
jgi:LPXTG-motif cell wall-anchored protein